MKGLQGEWRVRSRKHRYMLLYDNTLSVKWEIEPYPKGDNTEYELHTPSEYQFLIFDFMGGTANV